MNKQKGFTLTEIMIGVGVVSALMINGYNFYNNAIAKAQANEAMTAGKTVIDAVLDYHARFQSLPPSDSSTLNDPDSDNWGDNSSKDGPFAGIYEAFDGTSNGHIAKVEWIKHAGAEEGRVEVHFQDYDVQGAIAGKVVHFYLQRTANKSHVDYRGCRTSIEGGEFDGVDNGAGGILANRSVLLPECRVGLANTSADDALAAPAGLAIE